MKILFFDIETAPNLGWVWGKWQQNVIDFEALWYMLSFSAKWQNGKHITKGLIDYKGYSRNKENDKKLVFDLWKLFDEADILIAHNGDSFDIKKANARFTYYNLKPPSPYKTVDTLKVAKRFFNFPSNKLDEIGKNLNIGQKEQTGGFELWKDCMNGEPKAWRKMKKYNKQDVVLLEKVYDRFLPWMTNHPSVALMDEKELACSNCGSEKVTRRGFTYTAVSKFQRWQCVNCGKWSRGSKSESFRVKIR